MRENPVTVTPVPSSTPGETWRSGAVESAAVCRVYPGVLALEMLSPVMSSACCCAIKPRSAVSRPVNAEIDIAQALASTMLSRCGGVDQPVGE